MAVVRVRQHVNPLSQKYQGVPELPNWAEIYANPGQPLHIDIGSAKGHFLRQMARQCPDWNFLGLEIRQPLVDYCLAQRDRDQQPNLHFVFCNANPTLAPLLASLPTAALHRVSIQFPDPWFKKRHQKRRVVQPELVQTLVTALPAGGEIIIQSDVEAVAIAMVETLAAHPALSQDPPHWLSQSPFPAQTDREALTLAKGLPVYRARFSVNSQPIAPCDRPLSLDSPSEP